MRAGRVEAAAGEEAWRLRRHATRRAQGQAARAARRAVTSSASGWAAVSTKRSIQSHPIYPSKNLSTNGP